MSCVVAGTGAFTFITLTTAEVNRHTAGKLHEMAKSPHLMSQACITKQHAAVSAPGARFCNASTLVPLKVLEDKIGQGMEERTGGAQVASIRVVNGDNVPSVHQVSAQDRRPQYEGRLILKWHHHGVEAPMYCHRIITWIPPPCEVTIILISSAVAC